MEASINRDKSLANDLLVELLSYQFALPVRWIETQDDLLQRKIAAQRYVEIGPAKILATMAKKMSLQSSSSPTMSRKFLSFNDDKSEIYYEYPEDEGAAEEVKVEDLQVSKIKVTNSNQSAVPVVSAPEPVKNAAKTPAPGLPKKLQIEIPLTATDILLALTSKKLKRPFDNVPLSKSIRELSGGKSTLQNELIGDFGAEFGNLPDGSEDLPLEALGAAVQNGFAGKPGKQISALISRFISSKMPPGFNQASIREHLLGYWAMLESQQTTILCFAVTMEPASRLTDVEEAKDFVDSVVQRYASYSGISCIPSLKDDAAGAQSAMIDSASLNALKSDQKEFHKRQFDILSRYLGVDNAGGHQMLDLIKAEAKVLEDRLSQWNAEYDEDFLQGIQSKFSALKIRRYDSWWNWAREDLILLFNDARFGCTLLEGPEAGGRVQLLLNRWDSSCSEIVEFAINTQSKLAINPRSNSTTTDLRLVSQKLLRLADMALVTDPVFRYTLPTLAPKVVIRSSGAVEYREEPRTTVDSSRSYSRLIQHGLRVPGTQGRTPYIHIRRQSDGGEGDWKFDSSSTDLLLDVLAVAESQGLTYSGKLVLVTGAGPRSIGAEIVKGLLSGGARVILTTSRAPSDTAKFYQSLYRKFGARGSELSVLPFNQASQADCAALIEYIYTVYGDLDFVLPFAAIPDLGEMDSLGSKSELSHRAMLVNVFRLLGHVRQQKVKLRLETKFTNVILPLSPNHGTFGGDGLYGESKIGLETLLNRFSSESWSDCLTICGAVIGWTRGTGIMEGNNTVAQDVESHGAITFSQSEMALNILALMAPQVVMLCEDAPIYVDLNGGLQFVRNLKKIMTSARERILSESSLKKALLAENLRHEAVLKGHRSNSAAVERRRTRAMLDVGMPELTDYKTMTSGIQDLQGMVDLKHTVVVVGYSELGPWGSSRTRWEMEHLGDFTMEGYVEMAWLMGLIKHFDGNLGTGHYIGWVDVLTKQPVHDDEIREKYGEQILTHSGLRFIEPEGLGGYDPAKKEFLHEVVVNEDLPPFEASKSVAEAFKLRHGSGVTVEAIQGSEECRVQVKRGAHILVPKAIPFDRTVAGQLPKGWDPIKYGIPEDIISQTDPNTLYALCCVCEALLSAGIQDPYEIYKYIHFSDLANCLGTGAGSMLAARGVYKDRYLDKPVQNDILQESFLNTMGAWVNMLLFGSTGPIKTPVGACATAIESLEIGCDAIVSGKSKIAIVGGSDDFQEEVSFEFANMKATTSSWEELKRGRLPSEMSRPASESRSGFVESAGGGVQIIMSAELALEMGVPIHGIVVKSQLASDKIGRSVPAPGHGILTAARESTQARDSKLLDLAYRRIHLRETAAEVERWRRSSVAKLPQSVDTINHTAMSRVREAQSIWGNDIRKQDPNIAPLRASLATWGLTIDDIEVVSLHGTSTKANDLNEANVVNMQMAHLGRSKGNPLPAICQKYLTGHPKGAAGAWQLNGLLQVIRTGIIPGNRNADNIDQHLRDFQHVVYPTQTIYKSTGVKAAMVTSFGFGQKGATAIVVAPKYLFSAVRAATFEDYRTRVTNRQMRANIAFAKGLMTNSLFKAKTQSPWESMGESKAMLDPDSRLSSGNQENLDKLQPVQATFQSQKSQKIHNIVSEKLAEIVSAKNPHTAIGVDVKDMACLDIGNEEFVKSNFTSNECQYCRNAPDSRASFAGRLCAKDAVLKSLGSPNAGDFSMNDVEVLNDELGVPKVALHGKVKDIAMVEGFLGIEISISHTGETVTAVALAERSPV